ncbi:MAG TPA: prephenate dehydrogenase/arogenate dehydrogenase family protein [Thermodesulfobacteriaceae bacterium]|nr:prephenate dehydrogenase/arogenate dehydrogenase family protein [Thermodesulfobacteriaceae bacterium]
MKPSLIGIVGGLGKMGAWFRRVFEEAGYTVLVSDLDTPLTNRNLAERCEVVIVSVPMPVFPRVIREIGPYLPKNAGLIDLCSLKAREVKLMLEHSTSEVVGAHPLFGPYEKGLQGQTVALCPARGQTWYQWFKDFLEEKGARTVTVSPEEHDRIMSLVQVLNHFWLLVLGRTIEKSRLSLEKLVALSTPSFKRQLEIFSRLAPQDPELYTAIQFDNPLGDETRKLFWQLSKELSEIIAHRDRKTYIEYFKDMQILARKVGTFLSTSANPKQKSPKNDHQDTEDLSTGHPAKQ